MSSLNMRIDAVPFECLEVDVALAGYFGDDRPLRGAAARADWRLCGSVSRMLVDGLLEGSAGEALLLSGQGHVRAPRILLIGLGPRRTLAENEFERILTDALARCVDLRCSKIGLAPPGIGGDDVPRHARAIVAAALAAAKRSPAPLEILVVQRPPKVAAAVRALREAADLLEATAIRIDAPADLLVHRSVAPHAPHVGPL